MNTLEVIKSRRSCRHFNAKQIAGDTIIELIDCARLAPTARNVQPWEFVAICKKGTLKTIGELVPNGRFIAGCSCCIAVFCEDTKYYLEDGAAATENILLAATDLGLASCWVAGDKKDYCEQIKALLDAPKNLKLVSLIALGYPEPGMQTEVPRKTVKEILHWEKF